MQVFLVISIFKEAQNLNIVAAILKCAQQPGHVFVMSSVWEILHTWFLTSLLTTTLGYGCSWAILLFAKHAPNSKIISLKIGNWIIARKNWFSWPCQGCQVSCRFLSFPPISSEMEWHHINTAWLPRQFQNGTNLFLQDSRHFRGLNLCGWKSWMFNLL